jgi:hypothetical protein
MNINPNFSSDSDEMPSADEVVSHGMSFIAETLIEPMHDKLSKEDKSLLALIGMSFAIVAEQATAYEQMEQAKNFDDLNEDKTIGFFRN